MTKAQDKTDPLESYSPKTSAGKLALDVTRYLVGDNWDQLPEKVRIRSVDAAQRFDSGESMHSRGRQASKREYDHWIDNLFRSTMAGVRREDLLIEFMNHLNGMIKDEKSDSLFALVLEEAKDDAGKPVYFLGRGVGRIHADHWKEFSKLLGSMQESQFFHESMHPENNLEVHLARYADHYSNEFDSLISAATSKRAKTGTRLRGDSQKARESKDRFWLSRIALRSSDPHQPHRALFVAYENTGDELVPKPASGAAQEWRVIYYLHIAYSQLDHRIKNLHNYVVHQRANLLVSLAPSVLSHEVAHLASIVSEATDHAAKAFQQLSLGKDETPALGRARLLLHDVIQAAISLNRTFSAYLNLERKSRVEIFLLRQVFDEAYQLCRLRLSGIDVRIEIAAASLEFCSDRALLTLVLINLMANAARAINEGSWPDEMTQGEKRIELFIDPLDDGLVRLVLANTGPPIAAELSGSIFDQGYSQYTDGHGQGLFIARMIAQYLGGDLTLVDPANYGEDFNVAFSFCIKLQLDLFGSE